MQVIMNNEDDVEFTKSLTDLINSQMDYYLQQINDNIGKVDDVEIIEGFYRLYDEIWKNTNQNVKEAISCKKGCSACCHINVDIHEVEARLIFQEYGYKKINWSVLEKQQGLDIFHRPKIEDSACIFLESKGNCGIYEYRPISCRKFFVVSPAELCDATKSGNTISIQPILDMEILTSVLTVAFPKVGVMADIMLNLRR